MLALGLGLIGCSLSERDLDAFRDTAMGPEKLQAVLRDTRSGDGLRAKAALTLLDLDRRDHDGRRLLFAELEKLDTRARDAIVPTFKDGLVARMQTPASTAPSARAIRAKDAGVELLPMLGDHERARLGAELLAWVAEDVERRAEVGRHHFGELAARVGASSADTLVAAVRPDMTPKAVARIATLVNEHASKGTRERAAARLVELERAFRSEEHTRIIEAQLAREGMAGAESGSEAQRAQVAAHRRVALLSQLMPALGLFADAAPARARLVQLARSTPIEPEQRSLALELLRGHVTTAELTPLLELALDEKEPADLRELALRRAGETHSRDALPSLLPLLMDRAHAGLRQSAGELTLELGGAEALPAFFRSLPHHFGVVYAKREIDAYSERINRFPPQISLLMLLGDKLHSALWWNRVLALRYFAARGTAEDAWRIRQHLLDPHPIEGDGWPHGHTVGQEAQAALTMAMERDHATRATTPSP